MALKTSKVFGGAWTSLAVHLSNKGRGASGFSANKERIGFVNHDARSAEWFTCQWVLYSEKPRAPSPLLRLYQDQTNATYLSYQQHHKPLENIFMLWAKSPVNLIQMFADWESSSRLLPHFPRSRPSGCQGYQVSSRRTPYTADRLVFVSSV